MVYIIKRKTAHYADGTETPDTYFMGKVGIFTTLTHDAENAEHFKTKADAQKVANTLGQRFYIVKVDERG